MTKYLDLFSRYQGDDLEKELLAKYLSNKSAACIDVDFKNGKAIIDAQFDPTYMYNGVSDPYVYDNVKGLFFNVNEAEGVKLPGLDFSIFDVTGFSYMIEYFPNAGYKDGAVHYLTQIDSATTAPILYYDHPNYRCRTGDAAGAHFFALGNPNPRVNKKNVVAVVTTGATGADFYHVSDSGTVTGSDTDSNGSNMGTHDLWVGGGLFPGGIGPMDGWIGRVIVCARQLTQEDVERFYDTGQFEPPSEVEDELTEFGFLPENTHTWINDEMSAQKEFLWACRIDLTGNDTQQTVPIMKFLTESGHKVLSITGSEAQRTFELDGVAGLSGGDEPGEGVLYVGLTDAGKYFVQFIGDNAADTYYTIFDSVTYSPYVQEFDLLGQTANSEYYFKGLRKGHSVRPVGTGDTA